MEQATPSDWLPLDARAEHLAEQLRRVAGSPSLALIQARPARPTAYALLLLHAALRRLTDTELADLVEQGGRGVPEQVHQAILAEASTRLRQPTIQRRRRGHHG